MNYSAYAGFKTILSLMMVFLSSFSSAANQNLWPHKDCTPTQEDRSNRSKLVGVWTGRFSFDGLDIEFISQKKSDGAYLLRDRSAESGGVVEVHEETGEWEVCANKYIAMPKSTDGEPIQFFEFPPRFEYEIISISEKTFIYRDAGLEITFEAKRVSDDYDFAP